MPTIDTLLDGVQAVLAVILLALAIRLLVQDSRPGEVRLFGRPVPRPRQLAAGYLLLALAAALHVLRDLTGYTLPLNLLSIAAFGTAVALIYAARRPALR